MVGCFVVCLVFLLLSTSILCQTRMLLACFISFSVTRGALPELPLVPAVITAQLVWFGIDGKTNILMCSNTVNELMGT